MKAKNLSAPPVVVQAPETNLQALEETSDHKYSRFKSHILCFPT